MLGKSWRGTWATVKAHFQRHLRRAEPRLRLVRTPPRIMWFSRCNGSLLQALDEFLRHGSVYAIVDLEFHLFCQSFVYVFSSSCPRLYEGLSLVTVVSFWSTLDCLCHPVWCALGFCWRSFWSWRGIHESGKQSSVCMSRPFVNMYTCFNINCWFTHKKRCKISKIVFKWWKFSSILLLKMII